MGQGGYIKLINSTDSDWTLISQHSYQMNSWSFPTKILKKTSQRVYIEWDEFIFHSPSDDAGEARYTLEDNSSFEIQARFKIQARMVGAFVLQVYFSNMKTSGNAQGATLQLGWHHDGTIAFILSGTSDQYTSFNLNAPDWMQDNISLLGDFPLKKMCIPGTHDAGMSVRTGSTAFAYDCNTITQSNNINWQLMLGARYFDIRPVISGGNYYTGHYGYISQISSWQGANGQSIQSIIDEINDFTGQHQELVVLNLSHTLNTDVGNSNYREFNQEEWNNLFRLLESLNNLYISTDTHVDLTQLTLKQFIETKAAVVVIVENNGVLPSALQGQGFYPYSSFYVYNSYANSNNVSTMADDQFSKMHNSMPSQYFLLSWTLTQDWKQATFCCLGVTSSIKALADEANQQLITLLYPEVTSNNFPNIILIDNLISSDATAMALAVNWFLHG
ncbi:hypothetical protein [Xenorhabdus stockiae]|uniref:hypothetical protein n=1 Tax=Xenorhabdus stockiae TaxID=351614 RepID=UPI00406326EE